MAQFEAIRSFGGKVSATKGRTVEIKDKAVIADLLRAGYIKAVGGKTPAAEKAAAEAKAAEEAAEAEKAAAEAKAAEEAAEAEKAAAEAKAAEEAKATAEAKPADAAPAPKTSK